MFWCVLECCLDKDANPVILVSDRCEKPYRSDGCECDSAPCAMGRSGGERLCPFGTQFG